jgi:hypothetical protein
MKSYSRTYAIVLITGILAHPTASVADTPVNLGKPISAAKDFLTGETISPERLEKTKESGLHMCYIVPGRPGERAGLRQQDVILAIDGIRFYGFQEYTMALRRNKTLNYVDMILNRDGKIITLRVTDVMSDRLSGFIPGSEYRHFTRLLASRNITLLPATQQAVYWFPPRAMAMAREWLDEGMTDEASARWLVGFAELYGAIVNQEFDNIHPVKEKIPVPFFRRLEKLCLAVAADADREEKLREFYLDAARGGFPDLEKKLFGEDQQFIMLFYPIRKHSWFAQGVAAASANSSVERKVERVPQYPPGTLHFELADGSTVTGKPLFPSITVTLSFGDAVVAIEKIVSVEFFEADATARIQLLNGDTVEGKVTLGTITVDVKGEKIEIDGSKVKSIRPSDQMSVTDH